tara:strand:- start:3262 stop:3441 length:180 start_codon:yes stop_codon:yes gene_type:complete
VTKDGKVAYHYTATGLMSQSVKDPAFVIDKIKKLHKKKLSTNELVTAYFGSLMSIWAFA